MHIGATAWAPAWSSIQLRRSSLLNPTLAAATTQTLDKPTSSVPQHSTLTHISNLDRVLCRPSQPILPIEDDSSKCPKPVNDTRSSRGFLGALNLSNFFPGGRKPEEMSPRSLIHLRRFLSSTPKPSPRRSIAHRWRELHGSGDWSGLLDPLNEDLRRELVRCGEMVQAAYQAFNSNPAASGPHPHVLLPDRSYRVTGHLHATSCIEMPAWVDEKAPWLSQRSSWVGYIAVCDNEREIQRMGRRDIVISLRGTGTCLEWAENLRTALVNVQEPVANVAPQQQPKVECGFLSLFKTKLPGGKSLSESVVEEVVRLVEFYKGEQLSITITGHSLGAALALLVADELSTCASNMPPIALFSFGGPRVGNRGFADRVEQRGVKVLRVVNEHDMVTKVPGVFPSEAMDRRQRGEGASVAPVAEKVLGVLDGAMPWAYSHVGRELRLDNRHSPYLKPNADPACCHDLEAYLHLVDGFLGSHCPFRSNAKRSVLRLMCHQGSNMKKLYTSKAATVLGAKLDRVDRAAMEHGHYDVNIGGLASPT